MEQNLYQGVVYIAFGDSYKKEARASIMSLRAVSSNLPVAVVTDEAWNEDPLPEYFVIREGSYGYNCKPKYLYKTSPFTETLYLDTDTYVARDIYPIFGLLQYYDIGVRFGGPQLNESPGLEFHTQCNSGVILFKKNERTQEAFDIWNRTYMETMERKKTTTNSKGLNDQRYLASAIAVSRARPVHLAEYLNFTLFDTIATYSPPVVYHSRLAEVREIDRVMTRRWNPKEDWQARLWLSNIKGALPRGVRRSDPLLAAAILLRRIANELRYRLMKIIY